jgi:hypothetical protein
LRANCTATPLLHSKGDAVWITVKADFHSALFNGSDTFSRFSAALPLEA